MAKAKYERLEAKIANLSWWKDVKAEGFPSSSMVFHFHPVAFLEQMKRIDVSFKYEIYHTGKIVELGDIDKAKDVAFIYIDKKGNNHDLGSYKLFEIDAYANGIKKSQMKASALLSEYTGIVSSKYGMVYYKKLG